MNEESLIVRFRASDVPKIATSIVKVYATFVFAKNGNSPSVFIENPSDISEHLGEILPSGFNVLKDRLTSVVDDSEYDLFFHHDKSHVYSFDESNLQHGAIYGRNEARRHYNKDRNSKITASKLIPLRDANEFEDHIYDVADICDEGYAIDICVIINKEKVKRVQNTKKKKKKNDSVENAIIEIPDERTVFSSITNSASLGNKRKQPATFTFPARKLAISLFAPIETLQRK